MNGGKEASDEDLEHLLLGDDFLDEERLQEQRAKERRLARKRRLEALEPTRSEKEEEEEQGPVPVVERIETRLESPQKPKTEEGAHDEGTTIPEVDGVRDEFDIFSSSVSPVIDNVASTLKKRDNTTDAPNVDQQQDWDDAEGYYKASIGELINMELPRSSTDIQFRVNGVIGKGVFSTVLKCATESGSDASTNLPPQVALKCIRHNETMAKAALNEMRYLQRFTSSPGIIPLLLPNGNVPLEFRGHTVLVFPYMEYNLRDVLAKFGKGVGLSLTAVRSYFGQMLAAATHLKNHNILHSDLKPDNILVSQDFSKVFLCDFGSAVSWSERVEMITPYLVSRFYRAPEIILGLVPDYAIDLWSLAVTVAELFLGKVLFSGATNNDMLNTFMQHLGPFSNRLIRQHLVQTKRFPIPAHFTQEVSAIGSTKKNTSLTSSIRTIAGTRSDFFAVACLTCSSKRHRIPSENCPLIPSRDSLSTKLFLCKVSRKPCSLSY